jgi:hypothetical protein
VVVSVARGPSTLYTVTHPRGVRVNKVRINDNSLDLAQKRVSRYTSHIAIQVREAYKKQNGGQDCGWLEFDELVFTKIESLAATTSGR